MDDDLKLGFTCRVRTLEETADRASVTFLTQAAVYWLPLERTETLAALKNSFASKSAVRVQFDARNAEILSAEPVLS